MGIIFTDTDSALKEYPDLFKQYFAKLVHHRLITSWLPSAVWSGDCLSTHYECQGRYSTSNYFRINNENTGQFERTLIIVDEGQCHYVEGCTAPTYSNACAAIVEIFALDGAYMRYTTIQNWSDNVYNLVTRRAKALKDATVEWIDGNLGAKTTMKYPSVYLDGEGAVEPCFRCLANAGQQDTGT